MDPLAWDRLPTDGVSCAPSTETLKAEAEPSRVRYIWLARKLLLPLPSLALLPILELGEYPSIEEPESFLIDDGMILAPEAEDTEVRRGPNIVALPLQEALPEIYRGKVLLKVGDNITTDHIMPAGAKILPLRSNVPALSQHVFQQVDPTFAQRAQKAGGGLIVGGQNYGQGSSREHAALCPMYLGVKAVLAQNFARIHKANLVNFGILPLEISEQDYAQIKQDDELEFPNLRQVLVENRGKVVAHNLTQKESSPSATICHSGKLTLF